MTTNELLEWCRLYLVEHPILQIPEDVFTSMTPEQASEITSTFGARTLLRLPKREQKFFEWVKEQDPEVWNDLWEGVDEEPYVVSLAFLKKMLDATRGFPICDLQTTDNYYFVPQLMEMQESKDFVEAVKNRFTSKQPLTVEQLLALEASLSAIDIWHFAYHHQLELGRAKQAVERLVEDNIILHLRRAEDLVNVVEE